MLKTHFAIRAPFDMTEHAACGRGKRLDSNPFSTDCRLCQNTDRHILALDEAKSARERAFQAQEPHTIKPMFGRTNDDGVLECYKCQGVLFRERPRSLHSYHYVCTGCGTSMYPLTETGMCQ